MFIMTTTTSTSLLLNKYVNFLQRQLLQIDFKSPASNAKINYKFYVILSPFILLLGPQAASIIDWMFSFLLLVDRP